MIGFGWSWRLCRRSVTGCAASHGKSWRYRSRRPDSLFDIWLRPLRLDLFPKSEVGKNCRYGGTIEVDFSEPAGAVSCGVGSMLLLAIPTRRVLASLTVQ